MRGGPDATLLAEAAPGACKPASGSPWWLPSKSRLACRGHSPAATRSRLDLPLPLGPMMSTLRGTQGGWHTACGSSPGTSVAGWGAERKWLPRNGAVKRQGLWRSMLCPTGPTAGSSTHLRPGCTSKLISRTSIAPSGELRYTLQVGVWASKPKRVGQQDRGGRHAVCAQTEHVGFPTVQQAGTDLHFTHRHHPFLFHTTGAGAVAAHRWKRTSSPSRRRGSGRGSSEPSGEEAGSSRPEEEMLLRGCGVGVGRVGQGTTQLMVRLLLASRLDSTANSESVYQPGMQQTGTICLLLQTCI